MGKTIKKLLLTARALLATTVLVLAVSTVTNKVFASTPGQVGGAPRCTVTAVGPRSNAFKNNAANSKTTVTFKVSGSSDCKAQLSANSFYAPSMNGRPYSKQTLYQRVTKVVQRGTHTMSVALPTQSTPAKGCYYQVDLTYGIKNHLPVIAYGHGKIDQCGQQSQPQPQLTCERLTFSVINRDAYTYEFKARAQVKNTSVNGYTFKFGDGKSKTVHTNNLTQSVRHTYDKGGKTFTARVTVSGKNVRSASGPSCVVKVATPKPPTTPTLLCESLTYSTVAGQANTYQFNATASASHTTITDYVFTFDDSDTRQVKTSKPSAAVTYAFSNNTAAHTANVTVNSTKLKNVTSQKCAVTIPADTQPTPDHLPTTGAGNVIGFFGATSLAGGLIHRFILRRKYIG